MLIATVLFAGLQAQGATQDRITIVGSSTVYPFSALVASHFARSGPFPSPLIRATSTAEGFKLFCSGLGAGTPDVSNASRPISPEERANCAKSGVQRIAEIRIGYDSLVLANARKAQVFSITLDQLWRAAAAYIPKDGHLIPNPFRSWRDLDRALPDRPIQLIGPAPGHGTRDAFVELVMEPRCRAAPSAAASTPHEQEIACNTIRTDGRWVDVDNVELILGKLASNPEAIGVLTYSYLEQFGNRIHAATVDGVAPSRDTIPTGQYPLSRPLFIYVKEAHLKTTTGLADYAAEFLSFCAAGAHGYLPEVGLVPLPAAELLQQRSAVAKLQRD